MIVTCLRDRQLTFELQLIIIINSDSRKSNNSRFETMELEVEDSVHHYFCPLFANHTSTAYQADLYQVHKPLI